MRVDAFDFDLPEALIALRPVSPRDSARLLEIGTACTDRRIGDLCGILRRGDLLVVNDTRVSPARLSGVRRRQGSEARVEVTLLKREDSRRWRALARPAKRLAPGDSITFNGEVSARVESRGVGGEAVLAFDSDEAAIEEAGVMPLPPYIASRRRPDARDFSDYQTVYARESGAVAAPTAGFHFTDELLNRLESSGVENVAVTLQVGAGTFLPVKAADTADHQMHAETGSISKAAAERINRARESGGRIVSVGTTSLRLLESAADSSGKIHAFTGETDLFIVPGYRFRCADMLMTNFHLPKSTLFMLVCAFGGTARMKAAYHHAIGAGYRFYSYGDACLIHPGEA